MTEHAAPTAPATVKDAPVRIVRKPATGARRARNLAVFAGVIALMIVFYVISILKIQALPPKPNAAQFGAATAAYGAVLPPLPLNNPALTRRANRADPQD